MENIYQFDTGRLKPDLLVGQEIERQERLLTSALWYHGMVGRVEAEGRITNNGEFLVRLSPDFEKKFVVTTKWNGKFIHAIIKVDVDGQRNGLVYFISQKFPFPSVLELIVFHKENQYPLSETSGAVLYKPVDSTGSKGGLVNGRESKFRKSSNMSRKHHEKRTIIRSGSETHLATQRYSENFPDLNKSLTNITNHVDDAPNKPKKPSFKLLSSKHLLLKLRPSNIKIRNKKLYHEPSDYTDYTQVKDTQDAMVREEIRRGISLGNRSPSLFGLNTVVTRSSAPSNSKKHSIDESVYVACTTGSSAIHRLSAGPTFDDRDSTTTLKAPTTPLVTAETCSETSTFDIYGLNRFEDCVTEEGPGQNDSPKFLGLSGFIDFSLSSCPPWCCRPTATCPDKQIINKTSVQLLAHDDSHVLLCKHLVLELHRILSVASASFWHCSVGYRAVFLPDSNPFLRDLLIRQTALTHFVMATIISTTSTEKRIALIFFWTKCADFLLTHVQDMFHFRSIFSAIFSDQILNLRVWKIVHRQDASLKLRMEILKEAIKNGCLMRTDFNQCIPDLVQLGTVFSDNDENMEIASKISLEIAMWTDQSFDNPSTKLMKMIKELDSTITTAPFFREIVQSEVLICLTVGKSHTSYLDVTRQLEKVSDVLASMARTANETQV